MGTHTKTPWRVHDEFILAGGEGRGGKVIAMNHDRIHYEAESDNLANAAFIVRAVNAHDALVAACEELCFHLEANELVNRPDNPCNHYDQPAYDRAQAALRLAKGHAEGRGT
jgi:hypothetical protein